MSLLESGCYEISLGDTIGIGTPTQTLRLLEAFKAVKGNLDSIAVHFHDTYGMALANLTISLQSGIQVIDSSIAGLGGCPYAKGALGNVATEDVVFMLNAAGIQSGINLEQLLKTSQWIQQTLGISNQSRAAKALIQIKQNQQQQQQD